MNEQELREFIERRKPSEHLEVAGDLICFGCAHSAASEPFPSRPSGERPCCTCVRNPEREKWAEGKSSLANPFKIDDEGHARCFDAFQGFAYNGAPYVHFPMDNYVTLDHRDQERFYDQHPEYAKPITFDSAGRPIIVKEVRE